MSIKLFKETFLPICLDEFRVDDVYNWFLNGDRKWRVFKQGSEDVSSATMLHIATTMGRDEILYFNPIAENNQYIFKDIDIMFNDRDVRYALDIDDVYRILPDIGSYTSPKINRDYFDSVYDDDGDYDDEVIFSSGLKVFCTAPDEYSGPENKYRKHLEAMLDIHELYYTKNKDYGDAFTQSLDKHGPIAALVRMEDKWNRLSNLIAKGTEGYILSESVDDTLIDLANYAIMTALYLRGNRTDD